MRGNINTIPITQVRFSTDKDHLLILEYSLRCVAGPQGEDLYGLRVDKRNQEGLLLEREETPAFTNSHSEATALAKTFAVGTVPPCVLLEMLDEWYSTFDDQVS